MTKQEAAIISAYTGILIGSHEDYREYANKIMENVHWPEENGVPDLETFQGLLKQQSKKDFLNIKIED